MGENQVKCIQRYFHIAHSHSSRHYCADIQMILRCGHNTRQAWVKVQYSAGLFGGRLPYLVHPD